MVRGKLVVVLAWTGGVGVLAWGWAVASSWLTAVVVGGRGGSGVGRRGSYTPWWAGLDAAGVCAVVTVEVAVVRNGRADLVHVPGVVGWVLRSETRIHWVGIVSGDVVTLVLELADVEDGHHHAVLVDEVVAVKHVETVPWSVNSTNFSRLAWLEVDNVLESGRLVWKKTSRATGSLDNLERYKMNVDRVNTWAASVDNLPHLGGSLCRTSEDTVVHIVVVDTVDGPVVVASNLEVEGMRDIVGGLWPLNVWVERARNSTVVGPIADSIADVELHQLVSVVVDWSFAFRRGVGSGSHVVAHGEFLSSIWCKVKDDLVSLSGSHLDVLGVHW